MTLSNAEALLMGFCFASSPQDCGVVKILWGEIIIEDDMIHRPTLMNKYIFNEIISIRAYLERIHSTQMEIPSNDEGETKYVALRSISGPFVDLDLDSVTEELKNSNKARKKRFLANMFLSNGLKMGDDWVVPIHQSCKELVARLLTDLFEEEIDVEGFEIDRECLIKKLRMPFRSKFSEGKNVLFMVLNQEFFDDAVGV